MTTDSPPIGGEGMHPTQKFQFFHAKNDKRNVFVTIWFFQEKDPTSYHYVMWFLQTPNVLSDVLLCKTESGFSFKDHLFIFKFKSWEIIKNAC